MLGVMLSGCRIRDATRVWGQGIVPGPGVHWGCCYQGVGGGMLPGCGAKGCYQGMGRVGGDAARVWGVRYQGVWGDTMCGVGDALTNAHVPILLLC